MTPLSRRILETFQVRKTKKQKDAFIALLQQHFPNMQIQSGGFPRCRNLIIGDVDRAEILLSAHYDTCARLPVPNFIAPKNMFLTIGYSLLITLPFLILGVLLPRLTEQVALQWLFTLAGWLSLLVLFCGPANPHTANDNTSGVIALCELLTVLTDREKEKVAFVFFDHEETGLVGSSLFRSRYRKQLQGKLLINMDCIGDGDTVMLAVSKAARSAYGKRIDRCFNPTTDKSVLITPLEKTFYPSDQMGFPKAVAVAALKRKRFLGYYLDRIHTPKDTNLDYKNIKLLCDGIRMFIQAS